MFSFRLPTWLIVSFASLVLLKSITGFSETSQSEQARKFAGQVSLSAAVGQFENRDAGLSSRWMNLLGLDFLAGYQKRSWLLGVHGDWRTHGQSTHVTDTDATNLKGQAYLAGLGARYKFSDSWYAMMAFDFWGHYDFLQPSNSGLNTYMEAPLGLRLKSGIFFGSRKKLSIDGDVQYLNFNTYHFDGRDQDWKASLWFAGFALTYHFGASPKVTVPLEEPPIVKPEPSLAEELSQHVPVQQVGDSLMLQFSGDTSFTPNSSELTESAKTTFLEIVKLLAARPEQKLRVEGHTDSTGSAAWNQRLSKDRAESVKKFLVSNGVEADRIEALGHGSSKSLAENKTKESRAKNRRVEIFIDGK